MHLKWIRIGFDNTQPMFAGTRLDGTGLFLSQNEHEPINDFYESEAPRPEEIIAVTPQLLCAKVCQHFGESCMVTEFSGDWWEPPQPDGLTRVAAIVETAMDSFWATVAQAVPEAKSGDLPPLTVNRFQNEARRAIHVWLVANAPEVIRDSVRQAQSRQHTH